VLVLVLVHCNCCEAQVGLAYDQVIVLLAWFVVMGLFDVCSHVFCSAWLPLCIMESQQVSASPASGKKWEDSAKAGDVLKTVAFLRSGKSLDELCYEFGLRARPDKDLPLVLIKYQQLSAPFHRAVTRECRGLVLEQGNQWKVVA
jgi:hypothetical protein